MYIDLILIPNKLDDKLTKKLLIILELEKKLKYEEEKAKKESDRSTDCHLVTIDRLQEQNR